jgi:hemerythrin
MSIFTWNPSYSVSVEKFDNHHKKLIEMINELHEKMMEGKGKETMVNIVKNLKDYADYHFIAEEKLMEEHNYPQYEEHKSEHEAFFRKVKEIENDFNSDKRDVAIRTYRFLKDWLINHIQGVDKKYSDFFNTLEIY